MTVSLSQVISDRDTSPKKVLSYIALLQKNIFSIKRTLPSRKSISRLLFSWKNLRLSPPLIFLLGPLSPLYWFFLSTQATTVPRKRVHYVFQKRLYVPAGNYMFRVNNRNTRARCEISSELTIKTQRTSPLASFWFLF